MARLSKKHSKRKPRPLVDNVVDLRPSASRTGFAFVLSKYYRYFALSLLVLVLIAIVIAFHRDGGNSQSKQGTDKTIASVSKLMILPSNEQPTAATVEDKTRLSDKFLAAHAQNGDRVLIYAKNQLVIIYRPSINKIAAVGSVTVDQALVESKDATLAVLDGSNNPNKTQQIIKEINNAYPDIKVTDGGKTARQDYPSTIVIENTDGKEDLLLALIKATSAMQGVLPQGVQKTPTDMMIIVGQD